MNALAREVVARWGGDIATLRPLPSAKHTVFTFLCGERDLVGKLFGASRTPAAVAAEAEYVAHLAAHDVPVARPVRSRSGAYAEVIADARGDCSTALVTECARGTAAGPGEVEYWPRERIARWGAITGKLHAVSRAYGIPAGTRHHSLEETLALSRHVVGDTHPDVLAALAGVAAKLSALPRDANSFGVVHGDLTAANVFRENESLTIIDFESSFAGWYAFDIATAVYSALAFGDAVRSEQGLLASARFFTAFTSGYVRENTIMPVFLARLSDMLAFLALYTVVLRCAAGDETGAAASMPTVAAFVQPGGIGNHIDFEEIYTAALEDRK